MTARERVRSTQRALQVIIGSSALFWGVAALFAGLCIAAGINALVAMPPVVRGVLPALAGIAGLAVLGLVIWRGHFAWSFDRVALWIEERAPELRYALVTAVDPRYADTAAPLMEPLVSRVDTGAFVRKVATRSVLPSLAAMLVTIGIFFAIPSVYKPKLNLPDIVGGKNPLAEVGNRLIPLNGTLTAPAYSGWSTKQLHNPTTIMGLMGSRVMLTGHGTPDGIVATLGVPDSTPVVLPVTAGGDGWRISFPMNDSVAKLLKLTDRKYPQKLIIIDPRVDEAPGARLVSPERDTTLRTITGTLALRSDFNDDVGLSKSMYEFIISNTGDGDAAVGRFETLGVRSLSGQTGSNVLNIPYASLKLKEGDQISVRGIVLDNNTLSGPGVGYTETRTIRIARKSEYDTLSINAAPPSADTAILSLRMLIMATEKLDKAKPKLERAKFVDSSQKLAARAEVIRGKIQRIIDEQTGGGEIDANPLLVTALDAMWQASLSLQIAETGESIPQMYIALKALEKYRNEKKYNPRGKLKVPLVNIERVRMSGQDTGHATARPVVPAPPSGKERLSREYTSALGMLKEHPDSAVAIFTLMRVESLRQYPKLAAALGDAVQAIQDGKSVTQPLLRARRELEGSATVIDTLPLWSGSW